MAYRFNPPPNWPIDDQNWTPPPGWQPDPSWGPAPEGWNFWVDADAPVTDDATHVAGTGEPGPAEDAPDPVAPSAPADPVGPASPVDPAEDPAPVESGAETAEYDGPDHDAGLAQQAPYETAEPADPALQEQPEDSSASYAAGAAAGAGYGEQDYGPAAPSYGDAAPSDDQAAPAFGQESPYQAYGPGSPAYGHGSPGEYPGPGSPAPGMDSGSSWTAATGPGDAPQKGIVARFWWLGCIVLFLVFVLIVALIGGILLFGGDDETSGGDPTTTATQEDPTDEATQEEATAEETDEASPTEEATEEENEVVTPTNLPTVDDSAEPIDIVSSNGAGTLAVSMEWLPAEELPSQYGDTVTPSDEGEYLVATANITVTEGEMEFYSFFFEVVTPYGGSLSMDSATYELEGSGLDLSAPDTFSEGEEYSIRMLFAPTRAGGMELQYSNYTDVYSWDVPA